MCTKSYGIRLDDFLVEAAVSEDMMAHISLLGDPKELLLNLLEGMESDDIAALATVVFLLKHDARLKIELQNLPENWVALLQKEYEV